MPKLVLANTLWSQILIAKVKAKFNTIPKTPINTVVFNCCQLGMNTASKLITKVSNMAGEPT